MHHPPAHPVLVQTRSGPVNNNRSNNNNNNNDLQPLPGSDGVNHDLVSQQRPHPTPDSPVSDTFADSVSFPVILPSYSGPDNYFYRIKSAALTEETPVLVHTAGVASGNTPSAAAEQPFCSRSCLLVLGPVSAGLIVVALIAGLVIARRRRQKNSDSLEFRSSGGFGIRKHSGSNLMGYKGKEKLADDDDLMMEMFEPPELSISPNPRIMEWRHTGSADPYASAQAAMGRNTMLGLSTIMEESMMHDQARDKMYGNFRRKSSHKLTPIRLNSPRGLMRSDRSPMDTPPLSPSLGSSAQGSPSMVPFPMGSNVDAAIGPSAAAASSSFNQFLKPAPKKKRKLTIPYNPQDVTRRRSLEGAW